MLRKEFPHLREWCEDHFWLQAVSMGLSGMVGKSLKSIFLNNIPMNRIERNKGDFSYMPRTILFREYR